MNSKVRADFLKIIEDNLGIEASGVASTLADMDLFNDSKISSGVLHDFVKNMVLDRYTKSQSFYAAVDRYGFNYESVKSYIYRYPEFDFKKQ